jgi:quercetin dioxygenase-like cupin family protein
MPFLERPSVSGHGWTDVIAPGKLKDDRVLVRLGVFRAGETWQLESGDSGLTWFQLLEGSLIDADGSEFTTDHIVMLAGGERATLTAGSNATVVMAEVPRARDYDQDLQRGRVVHDWSREPVLSSEHDTRQRIYLASPQLWGTDAVKGEMIIYPPGASGAAHHHEGAEHFQYLLRGRGRAQTPVGALDLQAGDFVYNFENEIHSFSNDYDEDMVFVEFFVPGESRTVWVPGADACAWNPTGRDIKGRDPARHVAGHVHGEGDV